MELHSLEIMFRGRKLDAIDVHVVCGEVGETAVAGVAVGIKPQIAWWGGAVTAVRHGRHSVEKRGKKGDAPERGGWVVMKILAFFWKRVVYKRGACWKQVSSSARGSATLTSRILLKETKKKKRRGVKKECCARK